MSKTEVVALLRAWANEKFDDAYAVKVVRSEGIWDVRVEFDEEGYYEEHHGFVVENGKLRHVGVTVIEA